MSQKKISNAIVSDQKPLLKPFLMNVNLFDQLQPDKRFFIFLRKSGSDPLSLAGKKNLGPQVHVLNFT